MNATHAAWEVAHKELDATAVGIGDHVGIRGAMERKMAESEEGKEKHAGSERKEWQRMSRGGIGAMGGSRREWVLKKTNVGA